MPCVHLRKLYQLCEDEGLKLSGGDLIHVVCHQCGIQDVCPAMLVDEYEATHPSGTGVDARKDVTPNAENPR